MENYFKNHNLYKNAKITKEIQFNLVYPQYKKDLDDIIKKPSNLKILEIGCGMGKFAYFCDKIGVKNYTGIDIDDYFFDSCKEDFKGYEFKKISFQEYLKNHQNKFDIVFTSHVFEHLDERERVEMITGIYGGLKQGGTWINYMPNANNYLLLGTVRYGDITHKSVYNENSFSQIVYSTNLPFEIENRNVYVGLTWRKRFIHLLFLSFTKIYYLGMGAHFPKIYTWEILNILKKK